MPERRVSVVPERRALGWGEIVLGAVTLALAIGLKLFYGSATPEQLVWILAPTVHLLEVVTGTPFLFEAGEGYLSPELNLLVAPSCAGLNFCVATLCTGVFGFAPDARGASEKVALLASSALAAYGLTILANAARLVVSIRLTPLLRAPTDLPYGTLHRVEGVVVYFTALCVTYLVARRRVAARRA